MTNAVHDRTVEVPNFITRRSGDRNTSLPLRVASYFLALVAASKLTEQATIAAGDQTQFSSSARIILTDPSAFSLERLGWSVAADADKVLVGAPLGDPGGSALVFDRATGQLLRRLKADHPASADLFASDVDVSGDLAIIGVGQGDTAYLFDMNSGVQLKQLNDPAGGGDFGDSVAISGQYALVGNEYDDINGYASGAAYIFNVSTGMVVRTLRPSDGRSFDSFGSDVEIDGNTIVIGAPGANSIYQFDLQTGQEVRKITRGFGDAFGGGLSIDHDRVLVGAFKSPAAYLFDLNTGAEIAKLTAPGATRRDEFGLHVALDGDLAVVGARETTVGGVQSAGLVYLFDAASGALSRTIELSHYDVNNVFGHTVYTEGHTLFVGAPGINDFSGGVYVFEIPEPPTKVLASVCVLFGLIFATRVRRVAASPALSCWPRVGDRRLAACSP